MSIVDHSQILLMLVIVLELQGIKLSLQCAFDVQIYGALLLSAIAKTAPFWKCCRK